LRGKTSPRDAIYYIIAQAAGGVVAAIVVAFMKGNPALSPAGLDVVPALLAEFLFTFALCYVVLNVATSDATSGNSYFGFAIGFTVLIGAYAVGPISGGAFNPAVALGTTVMGLARLTDIWIYLLAEVLGGALAASAFRWVNR
jgi:aquaporin Z